jgi:hypothetical protein
MNVQVKVHTDVRTQIRVCCMKHTTSQYGCRFCTGSRRSGGGWLGALLCSWPRTKTRSVVISHDVPWLHLHGWLSSITTECIGSPQLSRAHAYF